MERGTDGFTVDDGLPITVKASSGAKVTINITVNRYLFDWGSLRRLLITRDNNNLSYHDFSMAMAGGTGRDEK